MIVWTDVETTGLDETQHMLLEVALLVTDDQLWPLDQGINVVLAVDEQRARGLMSDKVLDMHTTSGLLDMIRGSTTSPRRAHDLCAEYLAQHDTSGAPLAGNNVKFDRRWLDRYMPSVTEKVHYRDICVSSTKEMARRWFPAAYASCPAKRYGHRAMDDLRESIDELRHYLATMGVPSVDAA